MTTAMERAMETAVAAERAARPMACPHCHEAYDGGLGLWLETCDQVEDAQGGEVEAHYVACYACNMTGPTAPTAELAVAAWNELAGRAAAGRTVPSVLPVLVEVEPLVHAAADWMSRAHDQMTEPQREEYRSLLALHGKVLALRQLLAPLVAAGQGQGNDGTDGRDGRPAGSRRGAEAAPTQEGQG